MPKCKNATTLSMLVQREIKQVVENYVESSPAPKAGNREIVNSNSDISSNINILNLA